MRRGVALVAGGMLLAACSSAVTGQAGTDGAAVAALASAGVTPTGGTRDTSARTPAAATTTAPTTTAPTTSASTTSAPTPTPPQDDEVAPEVTLPPGFYAADGDLGYRPMTGDEFDCAPGQLSGCFGIMVFSAHGCPAGATVTLGIYDKARDAHQTIGTATGTTPPITADATQPVVIGDTTGVAADLTARVQQVVC